MKANPLNLIRAGVISLSAAFQSNPALAAEPRNDVIVVYNRRLPDSLSVAEHYAWRRSVPMNQVFGMDLPITETMTRAEFNEQLRQPLLRELTEKRLFTFGGASASGDSDKPDGKPIPPSKAHVRYAVLSFGVPLKITRDEKLTEPKADQIRPELRRNEASVDSELALLPSSQSNPLVFGPASNPVYGVTNTALLHPTNGILIVARLDGPNPEIARALVDKAIQAETDGLWGRAYFDVRGLTNGNYKLGDTWILGASTVARRLGFETFVDNRPETFTPGFPMSHIALYAGWYDGRVSGPFAQPTVEFMPGAIAYHLHSYSAASVRTPDQNWVGPLLLKGATATLGCVDEPYLEGTPNVVVLIERLLAFGFTFGEAAIACQPVLSWQTTVVGDPLYRPFGRSPKDQHEDLLQRKSKLIEWSHLRVVNLNLVTGLAATELINYIESDATMRQSAVLLEKLAELYLSLAKFPEGLSTLERALKLDLSPLQKIRLQLVYARVLSLYQEKEKSLAVYQQLLKENPEYPDQLLVLERALPVAKAANKTNVTEQIEKEILRLSPPPPPAKR